jgi:hypothetical protein
MMLAAAKVTQEANDLQTVVARMRGYMAEHWLTFRLFLDELSDDDFRRLAPLSRFGKFYYLERRFAEYLEDISRRTGDRDAR